MGESGILGLSMSSSSFKMKPVQNRQQVTYPAASTAHQQPQQYKDCSSECSEEIKHVKLPAEMCLEILSFLEARDLITLSTISQMWNNCCKDESLWKKLFCNDVDAQVYQKVKNSSW
jgi:hypothetical protein